MGAHEAAGGDATVETPAELADAATARADLDSIAQALRHTIWGLVRQQPLSLTPPQIQAMTVLVEHCRAADAAAEGLSLSELTALMGLAHSTVSGIVARLERQGLVVRAANPEDRRSVRIRIADKVRDWVERDLTALRLRPLANALSRTTPRERETVLRGLAILRRALAAPDA